MGVIFIFCDTFASLSLSLSLSLPLSLSLLSSEEIEKEEPSEQGKKTEKVKDNNLIN